MASKCLPKVATISEVHCIRRVCQLIERCDGHGGDVRGYGEV